MKTKTRYIVLRVVGTLSIIMVWVFLIHLFLSTDKMNPLNWLAILGAVYVAAFLTVNGIVKLFGLKPFDYIRHMRIYSRFKTLDQGQTVDVFLPICGEPDEVVRRTWSAVYKLNYPSRLLNVYVLDDRGEESKERMARQFGFKYLSRKNKGWFKKAGNLRHGFENSNGDFILIFDADFAPDPEIISHALPYMDDQKVGIVQTPQAFEYSNLTGLEQGACNIQDFFYNVVQPARDTFNAAICVGSNALYRRSALNKIGGTALIEHSEDVWTGFKLTNAGYRVKYLPVDMAFGTSPADTHSYFKQQTRWCLGSSTLVTSKDFWRAKLTPMQRLSYLGGFMFYPFCLLLLISPYLGFFLAAKGVYDPFFDYFLSSIHILVTCAVLIPFFVYRRSNINTMIAHLFASWSYSTALLKKFVLRRNEEWTPTGSKAGKKSGAYGVMLKVYSVYTAVNTVLLVYALFNFDLKPAIFYLVLNVFMHLLGGYYLFSEMRESRRTKKEPAELSIGAEEKPEQSAKKKKVKA